MMNKLEKLKNLDSDIQKSNITALLVAALLCLTGLLLSIWAKSAAPAILSLAVMFSTIAWRLFISFASINAFNITARCVQRHDNRLLQRSQCVFQSLDEQGLYFIMTIVSKSPICVGNDVKLIFQKDACNIKTDDTIIIHECLLQKIVNTNGFTKSGNRHNAKPSFSSKNFK